MTNNNGVDRWHREWLCSFRDLEKLEDMDLMSLVKSNCAWLVKDSRKDFGAILTETLTDEVPHRTVYVREYVVFLESGLWWRVRNVHIRLIYDRRGSGKIDMSQADYQALYDTYFPGKKPDRTVMVEGLEHKLHAEVRV